MYPTLLGLTKHDRTFKKFKDDIDKAIKNVFVNIRKTTERLSIEELMEKTMEHKDSRSHTVKKGKSAVILFIDWHHEPCLKAINRFRHALDKIQKKHQSTVTTGTPEVPDAYVFNVRNHMDMWNTIRKISKSSTRPHWTSIRCPSWCSLPKKNTTPSRRSKRTWKTTRPTRIARTLVRAFPKDIELKQTANSTVDFIDESESKRF